ncbi:MAG: hypothetical protein R2815_12135 [Flavobacteriales bacterium]|nr:hypothetical protein [Flavobacteriales bacterium]
MRNILSLAAPFALVATALNTSAQITFEFEDFPVAGDVIERYRDTLITFGPGGGGTGQTWDFSDADPMETIITTVSTPASTPYAAAFASSDLAMTTDGTSFLFFNAGPGTVIATGAAGDFLDDGQLLTVPFAPTLTGHQFPRVYGDHFTDTYALAVDANGAAFGVNMVRLHHRGEVHDTTDAYGEITTPIGTYDALRVRSTEYSTDSIWIRLFSFTPWTFLQAVRDTNTTYSWLAKETKLPVAEMTLDSLGAPASFTYSAIPPALVTHTPVRRDHGAHIGPIPASTQLTVYLEDGQRFRSGEVLAADGRRMATLLLGNTDRCTIDVQDWPTGMYQVRLWPHVDGPAVMIRAIVR